METPLSTQQKHSPPSDPQLWMERKNSRSTRNARRGPRRLRIPYLVLGALLIVLCTTGGVIAVQQAGHRQSILVLARAVIVGHVLTSRDLRPVSISVDSEMDVLSADHTPSVLGQPVAYSLPAGSVLSRAALGHPQVLPPGQALVAVAVKSGQFPPELSAGTMVSAIAVPGVSANSVNAAVPGGGWSAVVTTIVNGLNGQETVVSLQMPVDGARQVAAVPAGQLALVALSGGQ